MKESLPGKSENENKLPAISPLLAGILGNALQTSEPIQQHAAGLETRKCSNCGAARPADTNLQFCDFCNTPFY